MSFTSCVVYPSLCDVPLIERKKDATISVGFVLPTYGINASFAYGLTNHISMQSHVYCGLTGVGYLAQQSLGYYTKIKNRIYFENYYGAALGYGYETLWTTEYRKYGKYYQYFTQFNLGINGKNTNTTSGLGCRLAYINGRVKGDSNDYYYIEDQVDYQSSGFLLSPYIFWRKGSKRLIFNVHSQCLFNFSKIGPSCPFVIGISLQYKPRRITENYNAYEDEKIKNKTNGTHSIFIIGSEMNNNSYQYDEIEYQITRAYKPIIAKYEYYLDYWFSLGIGLNYQNYKGRVYSYSKEREFTYKLEALDISARSLFHYGDFSNIDMYSGFSFGRKIHRGSITIIKGNYDVDFKAFDGYSYQFIPFGIHYNFYKGFGINSEISIGSSIYSSLGLTYKL